MSRYIEEWKPIKEFEGLYEVSNFGQVRNNKGQILKPAIKKGHATNYKVVSLFKDGKGHTKTIHRLVAEAFIPNPNNLPCVNHKDEDGTNNFPNNLEWCTKQYNTNYGTAQERRREKIKGVLLSEEHKAKISDSMKTYRKNNAPWNKGTYVNKPYENVTPVKRINPDDGSEKVYVSIAEAVRENNVKQQNVSACIAGKRKTTGGFMWETIKPDDFCSYGKKAE